MPKKVIQLTKFSSALEMKCQRGNLVTGFSYLERPAGYKHHDNELDHFYIIFLVSGKLKLSSSLFSDQVVEDGQSVLIPQGYSLDIEVISAARFLIFVFDTPMIKTEVRILRHICQRAYKTEYRFVSLSLPERIKELVRFIVHCMKDHKISNMSFYEQMNSVIFNTIVSYYDWNTISDFFHALLDSKLDFKSFVLNNFLEADRNVNCLIALSGMPESTFHKRFKEEFGTTAKQWILAREAEFIYTEAKAKDVTPAILMEKLKLSNFNQLRLICKKYFGCSPVEFIERRQNEHLRALPEWDYAMSLEKVDYCVTS